MGRLGTGGRSPTAHPAITAFAQAPARPQHLGRGHLGHRCAGGGSSRRLGREFGEIAVGPARTGTANLPRTRAAAFPLAPPGSRSARRRPRARPGRGSPWVKAATQSECLTRNVPAITLCTAVYRRRESGAEANRIRWQSPYLPGGDARAQAAAGRRGVPPRRPRGRLACEVRTGEFRTRASRMCSLAPTDGPRPIGPYGIALRG
jgi:hypothetical protein